MLILRFLIITYCIYVHKTEKMSRKIQTRLILRFRITTYFINKAFQYNLSLFFIKRRQNKFVISVIAVYGWCLYFNQKYV